MPSGYATKYKPRATSIDITILGTESPILPSRINAATHAIISMMTCSARCAVGIMFLPKTKYENPNTAEKASSIKSLTAIIPARLFILPLPLVDADTIHRYKRLEAV